ncbi:hypothetical protein JMG10_07510 [Nostoc ellipsosporum NOK]|nr:hypothetical protein [Nostoc ellipsosporum NOK]
MEWIRVEIPVSFEYNGRGYKGILSRVYGGGDAHNYHLYVNKYYWGILFLGPAGWRFGSKKTELEEIADYFGDVVQAWYG